LKSGNKVSWIDACLDADAEVEVGRYKAGMVVAEQASALLVADVIGLSRMLDGRDLEIILKS
jgi:hypothetical protein